MRVTDLPPPAQAKLSKLNTHQMVSLDASRAIQGRLSGFGPGADPGLIAQLTAERDRHAARHRAISALVHKINQWLMELRLPPGAVLEAAPQIAIEAKNGQTLSAAIETARNEIKSLQQKLAAVRSAPLPKADQKNLAAAYVMQLAKPKITITPDGKFGTSIFDPNPDGRVCIATLLAWIDPDRFVAALEREIDATPEAALTLTATERAQRTAELSMLLEELERSEETLIETAQAQGIEVARRTDCSPPCVLGVRVVQPKAAAKAA